MGSAAGRRLDSAAAPPEWRTIQISAKDQLHGHRSRSERQDTGTAGLALRSGCLSVSLIEGCHGGRTETDGHLPVGPAPIIPLLRARHLLQPIVEMDTAQVGELIFRQFDGF